MGLKIDFESIIDKYELKITGVIHVGAHEGQEVYLYEKFKISSIALFEPLPNVYAKLYENYGQKYQTFNVALGNVEGVVTMNIENTNGNKSSSILKPHKHIDYYPHIVFNDTLSVNIQRLDSYTDTLKNYNMLVIDTQGYEMEVLKGGKVFLEKIDYIICEVNQEELYFDCPMVNDIDDFLESYDFSRVETSWSWDNETWGDALYIKNKQK